MKKSTKIKHTFLGLTLLLFSCQTVTEQNIYAQQNMTASVANVKSTASASGAHARVTKSTESNRLLDFVDTNTTEAQQLIQSLDSFYNIEVRNGFNGSVLVGYQGKVLYERYFGYANRSKKIPWDPSTPSQLASTSKPFTATAILWLHQHGYLNIYDEVSKYIEGFPYQKVTIEMLLNHRSGIPDYLKWATRYWSRTKNMTNDDLLELMKKYKPRVNFTSGTRFEYSNSNYALLASVLEEVTKLPYPKFMKEFIFEPLGLHNTFVYDPLEVKPLNLAISYKANWQVDPDMYADGIYGDKGIYSTVEDLYRWDRSFYSYVLLNPETLEMAYKGYSYERPGTRNYGLGWRMNEFPDGKKVIYHNGWWHGNNTVYFRFIQDDFTIVVLGNRYNRRIYKHSKAIHEIVQNMNNEAIDWEESGSPSSD